MTMSICGEHLVGEIEITVGQNVDFDAGEDGDALDFLAGFANALDVGDGARVVESVGEGQVFGMVGDGHVFVAAGLGGLGHFFDGVAAVGFDGVHVDVALEIGLRDQRGQGMVAGKIDLAEIFAHLRGNVIEFQLGVNFFFGFAGDWAFRHRAWPGCIRSRCIPFLERAGAGPRCGLSIR